MKVCIYSRVSTGEQETKNQYMVLSDWAKQRGYEVVSIYQEEESAWKAGHQRVLANLIADAGKRRFQVVLVWALDRLSREGALAILTLVQKVICLWSEGTLLSGDLDRSSWGNVRVALCLNWMGSQNGKPTKKRKD